MNGDYTKVPLRRDERWTGARMQEGRVLLDHEWNLNLDAASRAAQAAALDTIGPSGVPEGTDGFKVTGFTTTGGKTDLQLQAGHMWVDGLLALAPTPFTYLSQDQMGDLPATGTALVYLDVFVEHVQPGEDPLELVDPALGSGIDSAARTRVGYRVRVRPTTQTSCAAAFAEVDDLNESTGTVTISRTGPVAATDPCAPPGDPLGRLPDGLFRVEVLDRGPASGARFAWSYEDGAATVPAVAIAGNQVTLGQAAGIVFAPGDLVEVSWLARRADRADHGSLYTVLAPTPGTAPNVLTLDRAIPAQLANAVGLAVRRWDGQVSGATTDRNAALRGTDLGVRFKAATGALAYLPGDWWGSRLREEAAQGIEPRTNAAPDGVRHAFAPLALVDLAAKNVLTDCRPKFRPLVGMDFDAGCCTVSVKPGDDLQAAVDRLPDGGGELCLAAGLYALNAPVAVNGRERVVFVGAGPATILRAQQTEAAVVFQECDEVEVRHLRAEGATPPGGAAEKSLNGALTFLGCTDVVVSECVLACPPGGGRLQTCVTARSTPKVQPDRIRIERNRIEPGIWQTGVLLVDVDHATVESNHVVAQPLPPDQLLPLGQILQHEIHRILKAALKPTGQQPVTEVPVRGVDTPLKIAEGTRGAAALKEIAGLVTTQTIQRHGDAKRAILNVSRSILKDEALGRVRVVGVGGGGTPPPATTGQPPPPPPPPAPLPAATADLVAQVRREFRAGFQGIVVGGTRVGTVRILDNVVEGVVQGIHVGASSRRVQGRETVDEVQISRNVVHLNVPPTYDRERHAVFVGNARTVHVLDTIASLKRTVKTGEAVANATPVDGVRVHGELGPFFVVQKTSLQGFQTGVRVVPLGMPRQKLWLVAETMADGAQAALAAPDSVDKERNVP